LKKLTEVSKSVDRVKIELKELKDMQIQLQADIDTKVSQVEQTVYVNFGVPLKIQIILVGVSN